MRKTYLDNVRWITVILVLIYHVIYMFNGVTTQPIFGAFFDHQPQDIYQYIVYPWFMLLLFVVSGMSARFELGRRTTREFIKSRTRRYLVPSTLGLLAGGFILGYYNVLVGGGIEGVLSLPKPVAFIIFCFSGTGVLWYIQMLWIFSLVLVLIRKIEKDKLYNLCSKAGIVVTLLFTAVIFGASQILNTPVVIVYRFGIYGAGFLFGYFVLSHDEVMDRLERFYIPIDILALISCVVFIVRKWGQPYCEHVVMKSVECCIFAWLGTIGVLAFMKKWGNFENAFSKWMIKKSWGIYVFHYFAMAVTSYYLLKFVPDLPAIVYYLVATVSGFGGALILYEIISRIPGWRWCLLGVKGARK